MKITITLIVISFYGSIFGQWLPIFSSQNRVFHAVCFCNSNTGFMATATFSGPGTREIFSTFNGGLNWQATNIPTPFSLLDIYFVNCMTGYTVGVFGTAFKTSNGGINWFSINIGTTENLYRIQFIDENTGFTVGATNIIRQTTNSGVTWLNKDFSSGYYSFHGLHFINVNTGFIVGLGQYNAKVIIKTTNGGISWASQNAGSGGPQYLYDIYFVNENTGIIVGAGGILRTANGGNNWFVLDSVTQSLNSIFAIDQNNIWAAGVFVILKSSNAGNSWVQQYYNNNYASLRDIFFTDVNLGYAVGVDVHPGNSVGIVIKTTNGGISFVNNYGEMPINFLLYQNYPNPFNPSTTIQFDLPKKSIVKLTIYDITGVQIEVLANGQLQQGTHEYQWNANNYPSGVYFYNLKAEKFQQTRRMILLK